MDENKLCYCFVQLLQGVLCHLFVDFYLVYHMENGLESLSDITPGDDPP